MYLYEIDEKGFIINNYVKYENAFIPKDYISTQLPQPLPFYKPRWNGSKWTEGESEEEKELRRYTQYIESLKPSQQEIQKAQLEIEVLNIINELGVI